MHAPSSPASPPLRPAAALPPAIAAAVWRGGDIGQPPQRTVPSGWHALDRELPGHGWPCGALTEVLGAQPSVLEWRLLGPALAQVCVEGGSVLLVGAPVPPFLPGLRLLGIDPRHLVWVRARTPAERLWAVEQLLRTQGPGAILAWLPQALPEQLRRLHAHAQGAQALLFALRPQDARTQASPAPLRVQAAPGDGWTLHVDVFKRRGPAQSAPVCVQAVPGGLHAVLPERLRTSQPPAVETVDDLGCTVPADALSAVAA